MKKVILSIAVIAGLVITTNIQSMEVMPAQASIPLVLEYDGFEEVEFGELSDVVQAAINALSEEYDVKSLAYNTDEQLTKVELVKKEDQSTRTVFLDAEGQNVLRSLSAEETEAEKAVSEKEESQKKEIPSVGSEEVVPDSGFVNVKFNELNEKVQQALRTIVENCDITSMRYNAEQGITEVKGTAKEDQSEKIFYLNAEGEEVKQPAPQEHQQEQQIEEVPMSL